MSFAAPLVLLGLFALPVLVWLLRAMPPRPVRQVFGGMFFLKDLASPKQQPVRTPPLILILRLLAFSAIVVALAGPRLGEEAERIEGPVTLVVGDGWDAAQRWEERMSAAREAIRQSGGPVRLMTTTQPELSAPLTPEEAENALSRLQPQPGLADWPGVVAALPEGEGRVVLIPGGIAPPKGAIDTIRGLSASLPEGDSFVFGPPRVSGDAVSITLFRTGGEGEVVRRLRAVSRDGRTVSTEDVRFAPGERAAEATFRLPLALRNEVARITVEGSRSAGTVALLGASARRTLAGLVSGGTETLREGGFYITRALAPSAEIIEGPVAELVGRDPGLIILDDVGTLRREDRDALTGFVEDGGLLVRFSGPDLVAGERVPGDPLLPAPVLGGERALGGALTWAEPQKVARIDQATPLAGLTIDEEIAVRRQVLTEPGSGAEIWISLADGTPLVSGARRGAGLVVLVHVAAAPTWSELPVSGLFARLMGRLAALAETGLAAEPSAAGEPLPARKLLTGRGALVDPPADAPSFVPGETPPPPGLYGEGASELAVNAYRGDTAPDRFTPADLPRGARLLQKAEGSVRDLSAIILACALLLLSADAILSLSRFQRFGRAAAAGMAILLALPAAAGRAEAQIRPPLPPQATDAALALRFAYVRTGDPDLDRICERGLVGLTREATRRSALEPAEPQGVDPERDELSVYALIYWAVRPGQTPPSDSALQRLEAFMDGGGLLIIDTADGGAPGSSAALQSVIGRLDAPPLEPLPSDHVLLFSFYRLDDLFGREPGGRVWVETRGALDQRRDGVPSLIVSGRDWASAWAIDGRGVPLRPPGPGGEARREMAFRAGINMAMVAITGNYKADQADVQDMLDRLGEDGRDG